MKSTSEIAVMVLSVSCLLVIVSCSNRANPSDEQPTSPRMEHEWRGDPQKVTLAVSQEHGQPSDRIVSLAPSLTETLFALGAGDSVVGVTRFCDYPPQVEALPKVGGFIDPSVEAVAALKPDLVVAVPSPSNRNPVLTMRKLGLRVEVIDDSSLTSLITGLRTLGRLVGRPERGQALAQELESGLENIKRRVAGYPRPRVLLVLGHRPLVVAGPDSLPGQLLDIAGGANVVKKNARRYPVYSMERVLTEAPDVIVDISSSASPSSSNHARKDKWAASPDEDWWARWPSIPAVRNGRMYVAPSSLLMRPGPRIILGLESLAEFLHPEVFPPTSHERS